MSLITEETKRIQAITGALLCHARDFDNKLLVALGAIEMQAHSPAELTSTIINQLLNYVTTYPNDGIMFSKSDM